MDQELVGGILPRAFEVLDIWHGAEEIGRGAKAVYGQATAAAKEQAKAEAKGGKQRLLGEGYWGESQWIRELAEKCSEGDGGSWEEC